MLRRTRVMLFCAALFMGASWNAGAETFQLDAESFLGGLFDNERWNIALYIVDPTYSNGSNHYVAGTAKIRFNWSEQWGSPGEWVIEIDGNVVGTVNPIGGEVQESGSFTRNVALEEGANTVGGRIYWLDIGGAKKDIHPLSKTIYRDTTDPSKPSIVSVSGEGSAVLANGKRYVQPSVKPNGTKVVLLSFSASTDSGSGIKNYRIYRDGVLVKTATSNSSVEVEVGSYFTTYNFQVTAVDNVGNESAKSSVVMVVPDDGQSTGFTVVVDTGLSGFKNIKSATFIPQFAFTATKGQSEIFNSKIAQFMAVYKQGASDSADLETGTDSLSDITYGPDMSGIKIGPAMDSGYSETVTLNPARNNTNDSHVLVGIKYPSSVLSGAIAATARIDVPRLAASPTMVNLPDSVSGSFLGAYLVTDGSGSFTPTYVIEFPVGGYTLPGTIFRPSGRPHHVLEYTYGSSGLTVSTTYPSTSGNTSWLTGVSGNRMLRFAVRSTQAVRALTGVRVRTDYAKAGQYEYGTTTYQPVSGSDRLSFNVPMVLGDLTLGTAADIAGNTVFATPGEGMILRFKVRQPVKTDHVSASSSSFADVPPAASGAKIYDYEGDSISFKLYRDGVAVTSPMSIDTVQNAGILRFDAATGQYSINLETWLTGGTGTIPDDVYRLRLVTEEDLSNHPDAPPPVAYEFTVMVDESSPSTGQARPYLGSQTIRYLNTDTVQSNSRNVDLALTAQDNGSGIAKIVIWNSDGLPQASPPVSVKVSRTVGEYSGLAISAYAEPSGTPGDYRSAGVSFGTPPQAWYAELNLTASGEGLNRTYPGTVKLAGIPWQLSATDGPKSVSVIFFDAAGNLLSSQTSTVLDTVAPTDLNTGIQVIHTQNGSGTEVARLIWHTSTTDVAAAKVSYGGVDYLSSPGTGISRIADGDGYRWEADIPRTLLPAGYNSAFDTTVSIYDYAANSQTIVKTGHTVPALPSLAAAPANPSSAVPADTGIYRGYRTTWHLTSVGAQATETGIIVTRVLRGDGSEGTIPIQSQVIAADSGDFATFDLNASLDYPRGRIYYRIYADNGNDFRVTGPEVVHNIPNGVPEIPLLATETGSPGDPLFVHPGATVQWGASRDVEGDLVSYRLHLKTPDSGTTFEIAQGPDGTGTGYEALRPGHSYRLSDLIDKYNLDNAGNGIPESALDHESGLEWWISAYDGQVFNSESRTASVYAKVDARPPVIAGNAATHDGAYVVSAGRLLNIGIAEEGSDLVAYDGQDGLLEYRIGDGAWQVAGSFDEISTDTAITYHGNISLDVGTSGLYQLSLRAKDKAGNETTEIFPVLIDVDAPSVAGFSMETNQSGNLWVGRANQVEAEIALNDATSGIARLRYGYAPSSSADAANLVPLWYELAGSGWETGIAEIVRMLNTQDIPDGQSRYTVLQAFDGAGNASAYMISPRPLAIDRRIPVGTAVLDARSGPEWRPAVTLADLAGTAGASPSLRFAVVQSNQLAGTVHYGIRDHETGGLVGDWVTSFAGLATVGPLTNGRTYHIVERTTTVVNATGEIASQPVFIDSREPDSVAVSEGQSGTVTYGELLRWQVKAETQGSPITGIRYRFVHQDTAATLPVGGAWKDGANGAAMLATVRIPDSQAVGTYLGEIEVRDAVGHVRVFSPPAFSFTVAESAKVLVEDQGPYRGWDGIIRAAWQYTGTEAVALWRYRIIRDGSPGTWTPGDPDLRNLTAILAEDAEALNGTVAYRIEVAVETTEGSTVNGLSPGIRFDGDAPVIAVVDVPDYASGTFLPVDWEAEDAESGIRSVRARLETIELVDQGPEVRTVVLSDWMPLAGNASAEARPIGFTKAGNPVTVADGTAVIVVLSAENGAGRLAEARSVAIVVDASAPDLPLVTDAGAYLNPSSKEITDPADPQGPPVVIAGDNYTASWQWSVDDPDSGTAYSYALIGSRDVGKPIPSDTWTAATVGQRGVTIPAAAILAMPGLTDGTSLVLAVRAVNGAGLSSIGYTDGLIVDTTAPYRPVVQVRSGGNPANLDGGFVTTALPIALSVSSRDPESGIVSASYRLGTWGEAGAFIPVPVAGTVSATGGEIPDTGIGAEVLAEHYGEESIIVAEVIVKNGAGVDTAAYTVGSLVDTSLPAVTDLIAYPGNGSVVFAWDLVPGRAGIKSVEVRRHFTPAGGSVSESGPWTELAGAHVNTYETSIPEGIAYEGSYWLEVRARSRTLAMGEAGTSNISIVDRTPALFDATVESIPVFLDRNLRFIVAATDTLSGITRYRYILGDFANPETYHNEWYEADTQETGSEILSADIDIDGFSGSTPAHLDNAILYYQAKNSAGLWTPVRQSAAILVDHSTPMVTSVSSKAYTTTGTAIDANTVEAGDQESGIRSYRVKILAHDASIPATLDSADILLSGDSTERYTWIESVDAAALTALAHEGRYRVAVQVQNGALTWSPVVTGTLVEADLVDPVFAFDEAETSIVINEGSLSVPYTMSEDVVSVIFTLTLPEGGTEQIAANRTYVPGAVFEPPYVFDKTAYGIYNLSATVTDKAGRTGISATDQVVRMNTPPDGFVRPFMFTTPGYPVPLWASGFDDIDGDDGSITFTVVLSDGSEISAVSTRTTAPETGPSVHFAEIEWPFYHNPTESDPYPQETRYPIQVYFTDDRGKRSAVRDSEVVVLNTAAGILYTNEYWNGAHRIFGDIQVPIGLSLTVLPGTDVIVDLGADLSTNFAIWVDGGLFAGSGVWMGTEASNRLWKGIVVTGTAHLESMTIEHARRGVTIGPQAGVVVSNLKILRGLTGIHVFAPEQTIENTHFTDLRFYGVKLEEGAGAIMTDNVFNGVRRRFYDPGLTVLSLDEVNALSGSSGNRDGE